MLLAFLCSVALMVAAYNDCVSGGSGRTSGLTALCDRLLESRGYRVLTVFHDDFAPDPAAQSAPLKLVDKIKILEDKLKKVMAAQ